MSMACPACNSVRLRRSRSRGAVETALKRLHLKAYRCMDCGWRGRLTVRCPDIQPPGVRRRPIPLRRVPWLAIIVISILLALFLTLYISREPSPDPSAGARAPGCPPVRPA